MKYLKKITGIAVLVSIFFRAQAVNAIPIPTIGAELPNQIKMLQGHLDELKKVKDQITNGINQAQSMGDKLSLDALKGFAMDQGKGLLAGGGGALKVPSEMKETGYTDDVAKDPEQTKNWVEKNMKLGGKFDVEVQTKCNAMKKKLSEELTTSSLASGLAIQNQVASGKDEEEAQKAVDGASDQMQQIGANTAVLLKMLNTKATDLKMQASAAANMATDSLCR